MLDLGFEEDIIITKIQTSRTDFNTDISQLKALKDKGASSKIISAMMKQDSETPVEQNNQSGIYFESEGQKVKVLPSVFSASKTSTLASGLTYGIASAKVKSIINNSSSRNVINNEQPAFYFYFSPSDVLGQGGLDWWFRAATSPNEFVLVKLKSNERKNSRELETGSINAYVGSNYGIDSKKTIPFTIEQINDTEFVVAPYSPLEPGEYCFFYQGAVPQGGVNNQSVFDFSIQL
ncbi:MAG: hypothetical protein ACRCX5_14000 [Bacteroidales bacterium]